MSVIDFACFLCDLLFALCYFDIQQNDFRNIKFYNIVSFFILLMTILLYYQNTFGLFASSWTRFLYRLVILILFLILSKRGPLSKNIYCALYLSSIYTLCHNIFLTPLASPVLSGTMPITSSTTWNLVLCILIIVGTKSLCYAIVCHITPLKYLENGGLSSIITLIIITGAGLFIKETLVPLSNNGTSNTYELSLYSIILQISFLFLLVLLQRYQWQLREKQNRQLQNVANQSLMENISLVKKNIEDIQFLRHDLKNHMITLRLLISKQQTDDAVTYIDEFLGQASLPPLCVYTGNNLLDGLLSEKMNIAHNKGISFQVRLDFSESDFITAFDLCTIIGNLVDNAMEATSQMPNEEERFIEIRGGKAAGYLMIYIMNSYYLHPDIEDDQLHTTKTNSKQHGLGIRNVRHILEKYDGHLTLSTETGNVFIASVLIPIPESRPFDKQI